MRREDSRGAGGRGGGGGLARASLLSDDDGGGGGGAGAGGGSDAASSRQRDGLPARLPQQGREGRPAVPIDRASQRHEHDHRPLWNGGGSRTGLCAGAGGSRGGGRGSSTAATAAIDGGGGGRTGGGGGPHSADVGGQQHGLQERDLQQQGAQPALPGAGAAARSQRLPGQLHDGRGGSACRGTHARGTRGGGRGGGGGGGAAGAAAADGGGGGGAGEGGGSDAAPFVHEQLGLLRRAPQARQRPDAAVPGADMSRPSDGMAWVVRDG